MEVSKLKCYVILGWIALSLFGISFSATAHEAKTVKFLAFSGSVRQDSCNSRALKLLSDAAIAAGAKVTLINLTDYEMPFYNGDLENQSGLPETAKKLQALIADHDGILIATPEYNGFPPGLTKNALDWVSRPVKGNPKSGLSIFEGKVAALISASPGDLGGIRALPLQAQLLSNLGLLVLPNPIAVGDCLKVFDDNGNVTDAQIAALIKKEGTAAARLAQAIKNFE